MKLNVKIRQCVPGTYEARCPILPGCRGMGSTSDEALADFIRAARNALVTAREKPNVEQHAE